jgi:pescadillo protein
MKKYKRLLNKGEEKAAEIHYKKRPKYSLQTVVKERYPQFTDALRDLDDALCLISLFANFPTHIELKIRK